MPGRVRNEISGGIFLSAVIQGRDLRLSLPPEVTPARSGLPAATSAFCGRAAELSILLAALSPRHDGHRLVTVRGIAGAGKTELMLQAAHTALASGWFPGGVLFASAGGSNGREATQILDGFLRALGVPASQIPALAADKAQLYGLILSAFARRGTPVLVLIDNAAPESRIEPLLPADAVSRAIVACREPLRTPSGPVLTARTLGSGDGAELLHRVLNVAREGDARVRDDPMAGAAICRLCGGLPLALRIVGALLAENPALPVAAAAANLQDESSRLDELEYMGGSVRTCFSLSYQRLDPESARLFRLLSVHPDPCFSAEDAAAVAGTDPAAARHSLSALSCLLEDNTAGEQWQMPVLVRLYANEHGLRHTEEDGRAQALERLMTWRGLRPPGLSVPQEGNHAPLRILKRRRVAGQFLDALPDRRPFGRRDGKACGISRGEIRAEPVVTKYSLETRADPPDGRPGPLVSRVRVHAHRPDLPGLERMREHEPLHLGVRACPDRFSTQPRRTDLTGVGRRVRFRPRPVDQITERRRADHRVITSADYGEGHGRTLVPVCGRPFDQPTHPLLVPRHEDPSVQFAAVGRRRHESR